MSVRNLRGNALTMVLMLIGVIFVIVFAGTSLQPIEMRALDQHYEYQQAEARMDAALAEAVCTLDAGFDPALPSHDGVETKIVEIADDAVALAITCRAPAASASRTDGIPREWKLTARAVLHRNADHTVWRVASFGHVSAEIVAATSSP